MADLSTIINLAQRLRNVECLYRIDMKIQSIETNYEIRECLTLDKNLKLANIFYSTQKLPFANLILLTMLYLANKMKITHNLVN
jgi:hypothetical protein